MNYCDPDSDGDGVLDVEDCSVLDDSISDCNDHDPCTVDSCEAQGVCLHESGGLCPSGPFRVNTVEVNEWASDIQATAMPNAGFVAVYGGLQPGAMYEDLFAQRFDAAGNAAGAEIQVNEPYAGPDDQSAVALLSSGTFVVTWRGEDGIRVRRFLASGNAVGAGIRASINEKEQARYPDVIALPGAGYLVLWESMNPELTGFDVWAQRFGPADEKTGEEFMVNSFTAFDQSRPAGAPLSDGGFVVIWDGWGDGDPGGGIFGRRFSAAGVPQDAEFRLNTFTDNEQGAPEVVPLENGFAAAWFSEFQDGSDYSVYGREFSAEGVALGDEFSISLAPDVAQDAVRLAALPDGGYVAVWHEEQYEGDAGFSVLGRILYADGDSSDELPVNLNKSEQPWFPAVATLHHGGFVILWHSRFPPMGGPGIYARLFMADGTPL